MQKKIKKQRTVVDTLIEWTCDRCKAVATQKPGTKPLMWSTLRENDSPTYDFCFNCMIAFDRFAGGRVVQPIMPKKSDAQKRTEEYWGTVFTKPW
jgi:hypothetical protein